MSAPAATPMMAQYMAMRKCMPADIILFYRLGVFYEMFFDDAKTAAPILNLVLTKRGGTPMCGVPYHASQGYIARLLKANKRVAIAEQTSDPKLGKLVVREIARILSPCSIDDLTLLDDQRPNYLADHTRRVALSRNLDFLSLKAGSISILTVHQSKGLELDTVFIAGMTDDEFPSYYAKRDLKLEEERRLFYGAIPAPNAISYSAPIRTTNGTVRRHRAGSSIVRLPQTSQL